LASLIFAIATLLLTYPLALHPASQGRFDNGDTRLNAWTISWVAHQLSSDPLNLFEANTFYPLPHTLAFSEHLLVQGILALPMLEVTDDLVLTYNLVLLLSIFLSALGMYLLTVSLTGSRLAGILAGLFFSFAPYRFNRLPHLQMQLYAFLPLALLSLHRFLDTGKKRWAWGLAGFFLLQVLSGTYLAAMTAITVLIALVTLIPGSSRSGRELTGLAISLAVAALCIYPFARPYLWVNQHLGIEWDLPGIGMLSATPDSYLASSSRLYQPLTDALVPEESRRDFLFPGLTLPVLGLVGIAVLLFRWGGFDRPWATAVCYVVILLAGVALSLGPSTPVYSWLHENVVFFRGLRALTRFALMPLVSLSVLAGFALSWLLEGRGRLRNRRWAAAAIAIFFVAESTALPYSFTTFRDQPPDVYRWLAAEAEPGPIVELPFLVLDTRYMFWARHHGFRATLNGDSGFVPPSHQWLKILFLRFPSTDSVALLQSVGVRYVVLHLGAFRERALLRLLNGLERYRADLLKLRDFGRDTVLEVIPPKTDDPPRPAGPAIPISGQPLALFDSNTEAPWRAEESIQEVTIFLDNPQQISGLRLHYGGNPRSPVTRVEIAVPNEQDEQDGEDTPRDVWKSSPEWPALAELVLGLLERPDDGTQTLSVEPFEAKTILLRLKGYDGPPQITEIEVLGPADPN
jgi:hypothetical protein